MICPKCNQRVDPETSNEWFRLLESSNTPELVLLAVYVWDQSAMYRGGQSVLPTELRDAIKAQILP